MFNFDQIEFESDYAVKGNCFGGIDVTMSWLKKVR